MKTYNQIVSALSSIAAAHLQLKQFGNGDEWELVLNAQTYQQFQYPILWAVDVPAQVDEKVVTTKFRLIVADVVKRGEGNENEVKSDCFQIALDVMAQLYDIKQTQNYVWEIQRSTQLIPFTEKYDDYLTGWAFEISLNQLYNWSSCAVPSGVPTGISPEYVTIYDTDGVTVLATIAPGNSYTVTGGGGPCADATWELENTVGKNLDSGTIPSGGSNTIIAPDADVYIRKSNNALIASLSAPSGANTDYNVADSPVTVNTAAFASVKATESLNISVRKSTGNDEIGSKQGQFWSIPDSAISVLGTPLTDLKATDPLDINLTDENDGVIDIYAVVAPNQILVGSTDIYVNGTPATAATPGSLTPVNINVEYPDGTDVGVVNSTDVVIPNNRYNVSTMTQTGQTTSYAANDDGALQRGRLVNFTTLTENNPFGNTNRFTDSLGGQTYADNQVIDWAYRNEKNGVVAVWYRVPQTAATWANAMAGQPYSVGGNSWFIPNDNERHTILNRSLTTPYNYAPFNLTPLSPLWTSSTNANTTTLAIIFAISTGNANVDALGVSNAAKTNVYGFILIRYANITEFIP